MSPVEWLIFWNQAKESKHRASLWALWLWKAVTEQALHPSCFSCPLQFFSLSRSGIHIFAVLWDSSPHVLFGFNIFFTLVQLIPIVPEKGLWAALFLWFIKIFFSCNCYLFFEMLTFTFTIRGLYCLLLFYLLSVAFLFLSVKNYL